MIRCAECGEAVSKKHYNGRYCYRCAYMEVVEVWKAAEVRAEEWWREVERLRKLCADRPEGIMVCNASHEKQTRAKVWLKKIAVEGKKAAGRGEEI